MKQQRIAIHEFEDFKPLTFDKNQDWGKLKGQHHIV